MPNPVRFVPALVLFASAVATISASRAAQPPVPTGEVTKYSFAASKVFPGTVRDYWVYVPKQYDGKTPACVAVNSVSGPA